MKPTSIQAYNKLRVSGKLSLRRWEAYEVLYANGPMTAAELSARAWAWGYNGLWKRLSELSDLGYARTIGKRHCKITGHNSWVWAVTKKR